MSLTPWRIVRSERFYDDYVHFWRKRTADRRDTSRSKAVHVMDEEWDYLVILDACRLDLFREVVDPQSPSVLSGGSCTPEWMEFNFDRDCGDTVYVAGNPYFASANLKRALGRVPFAHVVEVWDSGWDEALRTVPPSKVTEGAREALAKHPDKRLIVHYNQPHHPFIGDPELIAMDEGTFNELEGGFWEGERKRTIWDAARDGQISKKRVWEGYRRNLELVMVEVGNLLELVHGRVVVSSDHGNLAGERFIWGHPKGVRLPDLVNVPWYVAKDEERAPPEVPPAGDGTEAEATRVRDRIRSLKRAGRL